MRINKKHEGELLKWFYYKFWKTNILLLKALRRLGQTISENLNINYFDEANTSKHHIIRHFKKDAEPQMFIN